MADKGKYATWGNHVGSVTLVPVIARWNNAHPHGLPLNPRVGARYIALATGYGWVAKRIYQWSGAVWNVTVPIPNAEVFVIQEGIRFIYEHRAWRTMGSHTQVGRHAFVRNTVGPRAAEWKKCTTGDPSRGTIRRGRASWAKPRGPLPSMSSMSSLSGSIDSVASSSRLPSSSFFSLSSVPAVSSSSPAASSSVVPVVSSSSSPAASSSVVPVVSSSSSPAASSSVVPVVSSSSLTSSSSSSV